MSIASSFHLDADDTKKQSSDTYLRHTFVSRLAIKGDTRDVSFYISNCILGYDNYFSCPEGRIPSSQPATNTYISELKRLFRIFLQPVFTTFVQKTSSSMHLTLSLTQTHKVYINNYFLIITIWQI